MKQSMKYGWLVVSLCVCFLIVGCASYYKVTDPQSGNTYYTEKIENVMGGAVKVKDARTGSIVTLQNSEVKEISEKDYKAGLAAPVSKPAPAPAAAPAPAPVAATAPAAVAEPSSAPTGTK
jgi:uncharacterized protein YceK